MQKMDNKKIKRIQFPISAVEKKIIVSIIEKIDKAKNNNEIRLINFSKLFKLLEKNEIKLLKRFIKIKPLAYSFKGSYLGIQNVPRNLIAIRNQKYKEKSKIKKIETQYLPKPVYLAYKKLNAALYKEIKKKLLIESGYRSPAYQAIVFLYWLEFYKFNFSKVIKISAIPGYSQHSFPKKQAIDFITTKGIPSDERPLDFRKTSEYKWLLKNANRFNFYQSYPRNNKLGLIFEPWHWQFIKLHKTSQEKLVDFAKQNLGKSYKYGAEFSKVPKFFDCSSFAQYLYKRIGINLPRTALEQAHLGKKVKPIKSNLMIGDLIFTKSIEGHYNPEFPQGIGHVAIYVGDGKIIQAKWKKNKNGSEGGEVREDKVEKILNRKDLIVIKRIFK